MTANDIKNIALGFAAALGSAISQALGGWDALLSILVCMMAADYATGLLLALVWRKSPKTEGGAFSSVESWKGLIRKGLVMVLVWVGTMLDKTIGSDACRDGLCIFFIANDGLSVLENAALMGVPCPDFVKKAMEVLKEKGEKGGGADG